MQLDKIGGFAEDGGAVIGTVTGFSPGAMPDLHSHARGQLAWCPDRPVTVLAEARLHLVPPNAAIWLPPGLMHRISAQGSRQSVNLYTLPEAAPLPSASTPFALAPLDCELIRTMASATRSDRREGAFARLASVLWDRLKRPAPVPRLSMPRDPRLRCIALAHIDGEGRSLDHWAGSLALSRRSLQRLVSRETGQSWSLWMRELRLGRGLAPLMAGRSVQAAAHVAGYATASSFVAAFRTAYGFTPGQMQRKLLP